jgi:hypothetical protein
MVRIPLEPACLRLFCVYIYLCRWGPLDWLIPHPGSCTDCVRSQKLKRHGARLQKENSNYRLTEDVAFCGLTLTFSFTSWNINYFWPTKERASMGAIHPAENACIILFYVCGKCPYVTPVAFLAEWTQAEVLVACSAVIPMWRRVGVPPSWPYES